MGVAEQPFAVKLFLAIMYRDEEILEKSLHMFNERYGEAEGGEVVLEVNKYTKYYDTEMGMGLRKNFMIFKKYIDRTNLPDIKTYTNQIEQLFLKDGKRMVNLDPGYITRDKLVLASTKNFYHRLYIDKGIYEEITLHYQHGGFRYFSWTYPDYQEPNVQKLFLKARAELAGAERKHNRNKDINSGIAF